MFNRQPYNRGKFNVPNIVGKEGSYGASLLKLGGLDVNPQQEMSGKGEALLRLGSKAIAEIKVFSEGNSGLLLSSNSVNATRVLDVYPISASLSLGSVANHTISGESFLKLTGLVLLAGDELVIDTCEMTVTLNGVNVMQYVSSDSEFFNLMPGDNNITYTDGVSKRDVSIDVLWKDKWI